MGALDQSPGCPAPRPELSPGCLSCLSVQTKLLRGVSCTETTLVDFEFVHIPAAVYFQTDSSVYKMIIFIAFLASPILPHCGNRLPGSTECNGKEGGLWNVDGLGSNPGSPIHQSTVLGLTSLSISFPNCKMGIMIASALKGLCED